MDQHHKDQKPSSNWKPFEVSIVDGKKAFNASALPKTMQTYCYDEYMVTRVCQDGILIDVYQEYVGFQICKDIYDESD